MALELGDNGFRLYLKNEVYRTAVHFFQSQTVQRRLLPTDAVRISPEQNRSLKSVEFVRGEEDFRQPQNT
ncbi:hypothetical protein O8B93_10300 [Agrobacterium rhizogenes]|uniref:hypothetical protein n=1 Tax=Rhizobium rhizogenes TaxID=359 RepID=UPI0022B5FF7E|nr:hypothetical protein [Rhizobium rhizogenes]MCZ7447974.1 hypothetical protein [Rhizobium rhizogenes]